MNLASKIAAIAMAVGCMAGTAAAQEPTEEDTIAWLQEKIPQAALGCSETHTRTVPSNPGFEDSWTKRFQSELLPSNKLGVYVYERAHTKKQMTFFGTQSGRSSEKNSSGFSRVEFSPSNLVAGTTTLKRNSVRGYTDENSNRKIVREYKCHLLSVRLEPHGVYSTDDGATSEARALAIEVNDWTLGERMKSAFEHWGKLEQSGAGEPF